MTKIYNIWQGKLVRLRGVEEEDWEVLYSWSLDPELDRLSSTYVFPHAKAYYKRWTAELAAKDHTESDEFRWMIENLAGEAVGTINSHSCYRRHGRFSYGLSIGRDHWRKGYASEAIFLVLRYFFMELGYQKVNPGVYSYNEASLGLHRSLGFKEEGVLRRMVYSGGEYHDEYHFGMTREEFEANENFNRR